MRIVKVLLSFAYFTDSKLLAFCLRVITSLTGNVNFPVTTPTVAEITTLTNDYSTALSNAADGGKTLTAIKKEKRLLLIRGMRRLAYFIQANGDNNEAIILSTGFDVNKDTQNTTLLPDTPTDLRLDYGELSGTADAKANPADYALMYEFRFTEDEYSPTARWIYLPLTTSPKTVITGITPGNHICAQIRSVNGKGVSNWSDPARLTFIR